MPVPADPAAVNAPDSHCQRLGCSCLCLHTAIQGATVPTALRVGRLQIEQGRSAGVAPASSLRPLPAGRHVYTLWQCRLPGIVCGHRMVRCRTSRTSRRCSQTSLHPQPANTCWLGRQAFCKDALEHGQYLLQARAAREAEDAAYFWRALFCQTKVLNAMHWCSQNSRLLLASADQVGNRQHAFVQPLHHHLDLQPSLPSDSLLLSRESYCYAAQHFQCVSVTQAPVQRHKAAAGSSQNYAAPFPVVSHSVPLTSTNPSSLPGTSTQQTLPT